MNDTENGTEDKKIKPITKTQNQHTDSRYKRKSLVSPAILVVLNSLLHAYMHLVLINCQRRHISLLLSLRQRRLFFPSNWRYFELDESNRLFLNLNIFFGALPSCCLFHPEISFYGVSLCEGTIQKARHLLTISYLNIENGEALRKVTANWFDSRNDMTLENTFGNSAEAFNSSSNSINADNFVAVELFNLQNRVNFLFI